jgi:hypothetical protein
LRTMAYKHLNSTIVIGHSSHVGNNVVGVLCTDK